ncbi:MAG TPA: hypothetical protein VFZ61_00875 [Polyangiales bacterium]
MHRTSLAVSFMLSLVACVPDLDTDEARVDAPRVLAVVAEPAESRPGAKVTYTALMADASGDRDQGVLAWFYCLAQKPLAQLGPVDPQCFDRGAGKLNRIGSGFEVEGSVPGNACALFGPNIPAPEEGEEPGRPVDPDDTGGYKQPVVLGFNAGEGDQLVLYEQRISCDLAGVSADTAAEYRLRYHANQNPALRDVLAERADGERVRLGAGGVLDVDRNEQVALTARWEECPESDVCGDGVCGPDEDRVDCADDCATPIGCAGQERYLWFDNQKRELKVRRESLSLAWYNTGGSYTDERTGADEDDTSLSSTNRWTAPDEGGDLSLWVVVRDARGGVGTLQLGVHVRE